MKVFGGMQDDNVLAWNVSKNTYNTFTLQHTKKVNVIKYLLDGSLASGSDDNSVKIWNVKTGTLLYSLSAGGGPILALDQLSNGYLVQGNSDPAPPDANEPSIRFWNLTTQTLVYTIPTPHGNNQINFLKVLPNNMLASGSNSPSGNLIIWDTTNFTQIRSLVGHTDHVLVLELLSSGFLASGSHDHTCKIWNPNNGSLLYSVSPFGGDVICVKQAMDGSLVIAGQNTGLYNWMLPAASVTTMSSSLFSGLGKCNSITSYNGIHDLVSCSSLSKSSILNQKFIYYLKIRLFICIWNR